jgi:hypothetical protein
MFEINEGELLTRAIWSDKKGVAMFEINEGELLTRVYKYELSRGTDQLRIDVHEVIAGEAEARFVAIPNLLWREDRKADKENCGFGDSEEEALRNCLNKIVNLPFALIVPLQF